MIVLDRVSKSYGTGGRVLDDISLTVDRGEIAAIVGPSGAGKSTLAKCINLLERPSSGKVSVDGVDLTELRGGALRGARQSIGTIFQNAVLLRRRTVAENVAIALDFLGVTRADRNQRVQELLGLVGLQGKADAYPAQLSGGQQQRVGIARALALRPSVLLADEATSGLDPDTTASILALLKRLRDELNLTIVLITHEMDVVRDAADTVWRLEQGRIVESGGLIEVLTEPKSQLARQLLPVRLNAAAPIGTRAWTAEYGPAEVPLNWLARLSASLGAEIGLLGASVEVVHGRQVGRVSVAVPDRIADAQVLGALARLGLSGRTATPQAQETRRWDEHAVA
jgi:D-methionine transport system ATP-binding protein